MTQAILAPLAVWDCNDRGGLWWRHMREASEWATAHFQGHAIRTYRAEFYLMDAPFAVLYSYRQRDDGHLYAGPGGEPERAEPLTLMLGELPPKHLLGAADAVAQDSR